MYTLISIFMLWLCNLLVSSFILSAEENSLVGVHNLPDFYVFGINFDISDDNIHIETVNTNDILEHGATELRDITRYSINVDVPFDFGSSDPFVPYLGSGSNSINIRGIEGNRINIYIDGIPQTQSFIANSWGNSNSGIGGTGRNFFDPAMYSSIQINRSTENIETCPMGFAGAISFNIPDPNKILLDKTKAFSQKSSYVEVSKSISNQLQLVEKNGNYAYLSKISVVEGNERKNMATETKYAPNPSDYKSQAALFRIKYNENKSSINADYEYFHSNIVTDLNSAELDEVNSRHLSNIFVYLEEDKIRETISLDYEKKSNLEFKSKVYFQNTKSNTLNIQRGGDDILTPEIEMRRDREQNNFHETTSKGFSSTILSQKTFGAINLATKIGISLKEEDSLNSFLRKEYLTLSNEDSYFDFDEMQYVEVYSRINDPEPTNGIGYCPSKLYNKGLFLNFDLTFGEKKEWYIGVANDFLNYKVKPNPNEDYLLRISRLNQAANEGIDDEFLIPNIKNYYNSYNTYSIKMAKKFNEGLIISYSFSNVQRNPTPEELSLIFEHPGDVPSIIIPNPDLISEKGKLNEFSLSKTSKYGAFSGSLFYNNFNDFIESDNLIREATGSYLNNDPNYPFVYDSAPIYQPINVGKVKTYGFELSGLLNIEKFNSEFSDYTISASLGKTLGINKNKNEWINNTDPLKYVLSIEKFTFKNKIYRQKLSISGTDEKRNFSNEFINIPDKYKKGHFIIDYSATCKINDHFDLVFGINNILNETYYKWSTVRRAVGHSSESNPVLNERLTEPGRNFFVSATTNF